MEDITYKEDTVLLNDLHHVLFYVTLFRPYVSVTLGERNEAVLK